MDEKLSDKLGDLTRWAYQIDNPGRTYSTWLGNRLSEASSTAAALEQSLADAREKLAAAVEDAYREGYGDAANESGAEHYMDCEKAWVQSETRAAITAQQTGEGE